MQKLNIEKALKQYGFTKKEAAEKSNINYSYFSLASSGTKNISVDKLLKIANSLNIPISDFFEQDDDSSMFRNEMICPYCSKKIKVFFSK